MNICAFVAIVCKLTAAMHVSRGEELLDLIHKPTAKENATVKKFRTEGGPAVREYCPSLTKDDCCRYVSLTSMSPICTKIESLRMWAVACIMTHVCHSSAVLSSSLSARQKQGIV